MWNQEICAIRKSGGTSFDGTLHCTCICFSFSIPLLGLQFRRWLASTKCCEPVIVEHDHAHIFVLTNLLNLLICQVVPSLVTDTLLCPLTSFQLRFLENFPIWEFHSPLLFNFSRRSYVWCIMNCFCTSACSKFIIYAHNMIKLSSNASNVKSIHSHWSH